MPKTVNRIAISSLTHGGIGRLLVRCLTPARRPPSGPGVHHAGDDQARDERQGRDEVDRRAEADEVRDDA